MQTAISPIRQIGQSPDCVRVSDLAVFEDRWITEPARPTDERFPSEYGPVDLFTWLVCERERMSFKNQVATILANGCGRVVLISGTP